jgi:hypothetical protein
MVKRERFLWGLLLSNVNAYEDHKRKCHQGLPDVVEHVEEVESIAVPVGENRALSLMPQAKPFKHQESQVEHIQSHSWKHPEYNFENQKESADLREHSAVVCSIIEVSLERPYRHTQCKDCLDEEEQANKDNQSS